MHQKKDDWKTFEKNNVTNYLNDLYAKKEKIYPAYVSKSNSIHGKQVIHLLIPNREKWHYFAVKKLFALLRGITKNYGDFYCFNCLHSLRTNNKLESYKRVYENKDFCSIIMPSEDTKILAVNQ